MTDRIDLLAKQCWNHRIDGTLIDGHLHFDYRKFAELIVQECLEQIDTVRDGCDEDGDYQQALGADWAGLAVARHFAVD